MEKSIPKVALPNPADYVTYRLAYGCRELLNLLELLPRVLADLDFPFWSGAHKIPARCHAGEETELVPDKRGHELRLHDVTVKHELHTHLVALRLAVGIEQVSKIMDEGPLSRGTHMLGCG